jgi:hypothetical protein
MAKMDQESEMADLLQLLAVMRMAAALLERVLGEGSNGEAGAMAARLADEVERVSRRCEAVAGMPSAPALRLVT